MTSYQQTKSMNNTKKQKDSQDMLLLLFVLFCFSDSISLYKIVQLDNTYQVLFHRFMACILVLLH